MRLCGFSSSKVLIRIGAGQGARGLWGSRQDTLNYCGMIICKSPIVTVWI